MKPINYRIPMPAVPFNPPVYVCQRALEPFQLDGNIDKTFWKAAPFTTDFVDIQGEHMQKPRFITKAKMLWDDENLYFAALLEGNEIWANVTERDEVIFNDNDFEIFIDPDSDTQKYYEFEMNARNTVWDLLLTKAYRDMGTPINGWDIKGLKTAVHINGKLNDPSADNKSWSIEVVMPFAALKECAYETRKPESGEYWRINFSRVQWLVEEKNGEFYKKIDKNTNLPYPEDNWVWAPTGVINIHYPELWGFVFFEDNSKDSGVKEYAIPKDERIKWQLRTVYYAEHRYWDEYGCFTADLSVLSDVNIDNRDIKIEVTTNTFEASCRNEDNTKDIIIFSDGRVIAVG